VKRGERPNKKTAIVRTGPDAFDTLEELRDRALLYLAFASGDRRRSEVAAADISDLRLIESDRYVYRLEHSKTQQPGPRATSTPDNSRRIVSICVDSDTKCAAGFGAFPALQSFQNIGET
jgi:hypothetical protein